MIQVVKYLQGTTDYGLHLAKKSGYLLQAWPDADWGRDKENRRSRSGIIVTIGGNTVIWTSKMQPSVSLSTSEAELYALSQCVRDEQLVRQFLLELDLDSHEPTKVYQDNLGAIRWTEEVQGLRKVKHVGLCYNFVKEAVQNQDVRVLYTASVKNKDDSLTKVLAESSFDYHRSLLMVARASSPEGVSE